MRHLQILKTALLGLLAAGWASVAQPVGAGDLEAVAPFVDDQTFALARLDLGQMDVPALFDKVKELMRASSGGQAAFPEQLTNQVQQLQEKMQSWVKRFREAGGREIYALASLYDVPLFLAVVPLPQESAAPALQDLMRLLCQDFDLGPVEQKIVGSALLLGKKQTLDRLASLRPAVRPELGQAFAAVRQFSCQFLLATTPDQRRVIEEMMPKLPAPGPNLSGSIVARGALWTAAGAASPPALAFKLQVQSQDPAAARALRDMLDQLSQWAARQADVQKTCPELDRIRPQLLPQVGGSGLVLDLQGRALEDLLLNLVKPLARGWEQAGTDRIASQVKQIGLALRMYEADMKLYPPALGVLTNYLPDASVLVNPRHPQRPIGYVYLQPSTNWAKFPPENQIMIHEWFDTWPAQGIWIGVIDGSARRIADRNEFERMLSESRQRNAAP